MPLLPKAVLSRGRSDHVRAALSISYRANSRAANTLQIINSIELAMF
jgi:hypothetical protein